MTLNVLLIVAGCVVGALLVALAVGVRSEQKKVRELVKEIEHDKAVLENEREAERKVAEMHTAGISAALDVLCDE